MIKQDTSLKTMLEFFYHFEKEKAGEVFLRQPFGKSWKEVSWKEAGQEARRIATALKSMGLKKGDHVGIFSKNCYHWIIADLAIMMGGFVSTPFFPNLFAGQLEEVIAKSHIKALFVGKIEDWNAAKDGVPQQVQIISLPHYPGNSKVEEGLQWNDLLLTHDPLAGNPLPDLEDLWTILFTSGTTGSPKGVMLKYKAPAALMRNELVNGKLKLFEGNEHRFFSFLPLNHIAERIIVETAAMMTGGTISFAESLNTFAQNLQLVQPTLFLAVPRIWTKFQMAILERIPQRLLSVLLFLPGISGFIKNKLKKALGLSQTRIVLTGAAPTPDSLKDWYKKLGIILQEVYGMTETCGGCTLMPSEYIKSGTVGKPIPEVELRTDKDNGEVLIKMPWLMSGYYNEPEKTAQILQDGWLRSGDQGEIDEEGFLRITGRVSDTFKSAKGKYIVPAPIEWQFAKNSFIEQICVTGLAVPQPLALIQLSDIGKSANKEEVMESLLNTLKRVNDNLPNYTQIAALIVVNMDWNVENGILTPTLKIKRPALNAIYQEKLMQWLQLRKQVIWE